MKYLLAINLLFLVACKTSFGQAGDFDVSFGDQGKVVTEIGKRNDYAFFSIIDNDSSIITSGYCTQLSGQRDGFLAKFKANGTKDSSFGWSGIVRTNFNTESDGISATAIQADGKIIAVGGVADDLLLIRYNPNGSRDTTFGNSGIVRTNLYPKQFARKVKLLPDGKILISGIINNGNNDDFGILRYHSNGILDTTFGTNGVSIFDFGGPQERNNVMKVLANGKILLAGKTYFNSVQTKPIIVRYNTNGVLDTTFGNMGKVVTNIPPDNFGVFTDIAMQSDGKIVAVGYSIEVSSNGAYDNKSLAIRYLANGMIDTSFGINGIVQTETLGGTDIAWSVTLQPDGKILVSGYASVGFPSFKSYCSLLRYKRDGQLDPTFGTNGVVLFDFYDGETNAAYSVALQNNGKILLTGIATGATSGKDLALARFCNDISTSIITSSLTGAFVVFPNPAKNTLSLQYSNLHIQSLKLTDVSGRIVKTFPAESKTLNISSIAAGLYFLQVKAKEGTVAKKVEIR